MRRLNLVALLGAVVVGLVAVGCGSPDAGDVGSDAGSVAATSVQGPTMRELLESEGDSRLVATMRGPGQIGYLPPVTRREGNAIVTVFDSGGAPACCGTSSACCHRAMSSDVHWRWRVTRPRHGGSC